MNIFFLLLVAHALCDYPLQGDFLAKAKNEKAPLPGIPWWQAMGAHCVIHAGGVYLVTGMLPLALAESACHFVIDREKCRGRIGFNHDQFAHVLCKVLWTAAFYWVNA